MKGNKHMKTITKLIYPAFALTCFALSPIVQAVTPAPDGGYPGENTAEGDDALFSLTTGNRNTAIGFEALYSNTSRDRNTATGKTALYSNTTGIRNTASGTAALENNTTGDNNTATGSQSLASNTTGSSNMAAGVSALISNTTGNYNTAVGSSALLNNTIGNNITAVGTNALFSNTVDNSTAVGASALGSNTTGEDNTAVGSFALANNLTGFGNTAVGRLALLSTTAPNNTAIGTFALQNNTTGFTNTAVGQAALINNTTGYENVALGGGAGFNLTTGNSNIDIGNPGIAGESNTIRIGTQGTQKKTFIAGISAAGVMGSAVKINGSGQLGVAPSSARFKDEIKPMNKASEAILALKPVTFRYKKEIDGERTPQFGLVAEDVEKVNPDLVVKDAEGKVYTVRYEAVNAMLLNEFLKQHRTVQEQKEIDALRAELKEQRALIQGVNDKVELNRPAPQMVANNH
jgi:hypothetical protein